MEIVEPPVTPVEFPSFRAEVRRAVRALSDAPYQRRAWIEGDLPPGIDYDNLDHQVHILFDDTDALTNPERHMGTVLYPDEADGLRALGDAFGPLLNELGDVGDIEYLDHPRWGDVVQRAAAAYRVMHANDEAHGIGRTST